MSAYICKVCGKRGSIWTNVNRCHDAADVNLEAAEVQAKAEQGETGRSFQTRAARIGKLVDEKNAAYGDSFSRSGKILAELYPDGIKPEQYKDALGVVRVIDKLFRIATRKEAFGESPWDDLAGYGIVAGGKE